MAPTTCQDEIAPSIIRIDVVQTMSNIIQCLLLSNEGGIKNDNDDDSIEYYYLWKKYVALH